MRFLKNLGGLKFHYVHQTTYQRPTKFGFRFSIKDLTPSV